MKSPGGKLLCHRKRAVSRRLACGTAKRNGQGMLDGSALLCQQIRAVSRRIAFASNLQRKTRNTRVSPRDPILVVRKTARFTAGVRAVSTAKKSARVSVRFALPAVYRRIKLCHKICAVSRRC